MVSYTNFSMQMLEKLNSCIVELNQSWIFPMFEKRNKETNLPGNSSLLIDLLLLRLEKVLSSFFDVKSFLFLKSINKQPQLHYIPYMRVLDSKPLFTFPKNVAGDLFAN